jgi:molybdopterin molybdotransferase
MDGYAVQAQSTFGASESLPALLRIVGVVEMGEVPTVSVQSGEAVRIATGGMLPDGTDSVVMIEHAHALDEHTLEVFKSVAPLQHVIEVGEDFRSEDQVLAKGSRIRPQEMGVLAALGQTHISVYRQPTVATISSGDEIVPIEQNPSLSQLRDYLGIARDNFDELHGLCKNALDQADMVLISGGSSVGSRDFTLEVIEALPDAEILVHGVSISPGKPTILAASKQKSIWGLPGQVTSAMVVLKISGLSEDRLVAEREVLAVLSRNLASVQGREDYVRVKLVLRENQIYAEPILGKSGLIHTMVKADGLIKIDMNSEGLDKGTHVRVVVF